VGEEGRKGGGGGLWGLSIADDDAPIQLMAARACGTTAKSGAVGRVAGCGQDCAVRMGWAGTGTIGCVSICQRGADAECMEWMGRQHSRSGDRLREQRPQWPGSGCRGRRAP